MPWKVKMNVSRELPRIEMYVACMRFANIKLTIYVTLTCCCFSSSLLFTLACVGAFAILQCSVILNRLFMPTTPLSKLLHHMGLTLYIYQHLSAIYVIKVKFILLGKNYKTYQFNSFS